MNKSQKKKRSKINSIILLTILFVTGLWTVDIGASALALQSAGFDVQVQTLFFIRSASQQYHIGLMLALLSFIIICLMFVNEVLNDKR